MRLAQRQIRPVVANRSHGFRETVARQRCGESKKGHERRAANGETRHQPPEAGLRARMTPRKRVIRPVRQKMRQLWDRGVDSSGLRPLRMTRLLGRMRETCGLACGAVGATMKRHDAASFTPVDCGSGGPGIIFVRFGARATFTACLFCATAFCNRTEFVGPSSGLRIPQQLLDEPPSFPLPTGAPQEAG